MTIRKKVRTIHQMTDRELLKYYHGLSTYRKANPPVGLMAELVLRLERKTD